MHKNNTQAAVQTSGSSDAAGQGLFQQIAALLLQRVDRLVERLTPEEMKRDINRRKRARMFLFSHIFGPFMGLPVPLGLWLVDPSPYPHVLILGLSIAGFWLFLGLLQLFPRHYILLSQLSILNLNFAVLWGAYHFGGVSSPFLMWYMLLPMLAFFYLGAGRWMRLAVFSQFLLGLGTFMAAYLIGGRTFPTHLPLSDLTTLGVMSAMCATTYAFFMASYYASVVDSQSELIREVNRHQETLAELIEAKDASDRYNTELQRAKAQLEARNSALESTRARLEHTASHDTLTGLPNRRYLDQRLAELADECAETDRGIAVFHVDLDRFKQINDTLGHPAGDAMLVHVARTLRLMGRKGDFVARAGGDEFIVIRTFSKLRSAGLEDFALQIIEKIRQPVPYEGHMCRFGASIGIATAVGTNVNATKLLVNSDIALYRAKDLGKNRWEFFSEEMQGQVIKTKQLADEILRGIEQNEFIPFYQPQFDADGKRIVGVEALVRWNHPQLGIVAPRDFLKVAEELNAVSSLDRQILTQVLADYRRWQAEGVPVPRVSVNVSMRRLNETTLVDTLQELDIQPGTVSFELVESIFLDETDQIVSSNIDRIKDLGIDIEIDDFGTGFASIVGLVKLQPTRLKIDRQFVAPIVMSEEKRKLVASIVDMGKSLNIEVVAEGVETISQARLLKAIGCDVLQGYAFAKPMSEGDLRQFAADWQLRLAS